ncbi:MAG TPA: hypothetical protein VFA39_18445 [Steroidobacteraceae bacterium]|nr:hypothetical protein [Steroidobacteraceae bacterium]
MAIYGLLLNLYPRPYLQQHRAEMLQNFQDLEQASPSKAKLWLFLANDLAISLRSQFIKTVWGQTVIVILVLSILLVYAGCHAVAREPIESFCFGYILGWFGRQWQVSVSDRSTWISSLPTRATFIVGVIVFAIAAWRAGSGSQSHFIWAFCYGLLLAWFAGWIGSRQQNRSSAGSGPPHSDR